MNRNRLPVIGLSLLLAASGAWATNQPPANESHNSNRSSNWNWNHNANRNSNNNHNSNSNNNSNSNHNKNSNHNWNWNHNSIKNSGNSASKSHAVGVGVGLGGKVDNSGNNTGNSSAKQSNMNQSVGNTTVTEVQGDTTVYKAQERNPASTAAAPNLVSGMDTCMGSTTVGAQGIGFGISFGNTWNDDNCVMLKNSTMLWNIGKQDAAVALLCTNEKVREALELSGTECPQTTRQRQQPRNATYDASDPFGRGQGRP
jgi:hypothetical protein